MNEIEVVRRLHQHRVWVNHKLIDISDSLSESKLHETFAIGQGSIWKTLTHLFAAEFVWLEAMEGSESPLAPGDRSGMLPGNQAGENAIQSLAELKRQWSELDARWDNYLAQLTSDSLSEMVYKINSKSGERMGTRRIDILLHVCTHAQYTVSQAVNMMRRVGVENLPDAMLISMAREE